MSHVMLNDELSLEELLIGLDMARRNDAVVREHAFHQCGPGVWVEFGVSSWPGDFSAAGSPVFLLLPKATLH